MAAGTLQAFHLNTSVRSDNQRCQLYDASQDLLVYLELYLILERHLPFVDMVDAMRNETYVVVVLAQ